jgi:hypothetical protein
MEFAQLCLLAFPLILIDVARLTPLILLLALIALLVTLILLLIVPFVPAVLVFHVGLQKIYSAIKMWMRIAGVVHGLSLFVTSCW